MSSKRMSSNLHTLPDELKMHLIRFCDGRSIISLGCLSESWRNFILSDCAFLSKKWRNVCYTEIPEDFILDILESLHPKRWLGDTAVAWNDIYVCWYLWRNLPSFKFTYDIMKVATIEHDITSVLFSGNWLFIGTREEGELQALNVETLERIRLYNKCGPIKSMYLRSTSPYNMKSGQFLSGADHDEVVLLLKRQTVCFSLITGKATIFHNMKDFLQLKHFEGQEVEITNQLYCSEIVSKDITSEKVSKMSVEGTLCTVLQIWNGGILLMFDSGHLKVFDYNLKPKKHPMNDIKLNVTDILVDRTHYEWHLGVIAILGPMSYADSWFEIYVKGAVRRYYPFTDINAMVTSMLYHAGILLLGTDLGDLLIYKVNTDAELVDLKLCDPAYSIRITEEPIVALTMKENHSGCPHIAAASTNNLFLITLDN